MRVAEVFQGEVGHDGPALAQELIRRGVDLHVVCAPWAGAAFEAAGAEVSRQSVGTGVASLTALRRVLAAVDVIHAHGVRAGLAATLARTGGTPLVLSWTEPVALAGAAGLVGRALTRTVMPATAAVLAATTELVDAARHLGATEVLLVPPVLPDAPRPGRTPEQVRDELALPADGPVVLAQARLVHESRLDVLVEACARWRGAGGPRVVLVGVGPAYRDLVARATVARAPVTFAGERGEQARGDGRTDPLGAGQADAGRATDDRASLSDLLAAATLAVVTDVHARPGFALSAVRSSVPIVVPQGGSVARLLGGEAGAGDGVVVVPPGDVDALDAAVRALLDDPVARADLAAAAWERVRTWPDAASMAVDLVRLYERVAQRPAADLAEPEPGEQDADADTPGRGR
ncbi:MAG TPA: glycosyltransferase [Micromonosporaceae bacterium]